jgi:predicted metalloprotease with PDZ domain
LPKFRIGPYRFKKIPITLFEDPYNATNFPTWSGLIGNDLLRRFNIVLNYPGKEIHIRPNRYFYEPFDYSYTGMELYLINKHIEVGFVAPSSPAALAGIEVGDQILAINKVIAGSLDACKAELNHAKRKITILYKRATKIETVEVKVIRIK